MNRSDGEDLELLSSGVNNQPKSKLKQYRYTEQQVEMAKLWAQHTTLSEIAKKLGIKTAGQVSESLKNFEPVAKQMFKDAKELMHAGYKKRLLKESGHFRDLLRRGLEAEEQMLREGRWPWSIPKHRHVRFYLIIGENREIEIDTARRAKTKKYIQEVANGVVPKQAAKENDIPYFWANMMLDDPILKGLYSFCPFRGKRKKLIHIPQIAAVDAETWNKAHKMHAYWATHGKKRKRAPLGTEWVGNSLVPHDPDNIIGRIRELRLKKYGVIRIAREVNKALQLEGEKALPDAHKSMKSISEGAVHKALQPKRIKFYIKLGMGTPEEWKQVQAIKVKNYNEDRGEDNKAAILTLLHESKDGLTARQIRERLSHPLSKTSIFKHLHELNKIVEEDPKHVGRYFIKSPKIAA